MRTTPPELVAVATALSELAAEVRQLRLDLAVGRGGDAPGDAAVVIAIAASVGSRWFSARELYAHARTDATLMHTLACALLDTPRQAGKFLRRLTGRPVGGFLVERGPARRDGAWWRLVPWDGAGVRE